MQRAQLWTFSIINFKGGIFFLKAMAAGAFNQITASTTTKSAFADSQTGQV